MQRSLYAIAQLLVATTGLGLLAMGLITLVVTDELDYAYTLFNELM